MQIVIGALRLLWKTLIKVAKLLIIISQFLFSLPQLFRRVAAALPGMETTENKSSGDSILLLLRYHKIFAFQAACNKLINAPLCFLLVDLYAVTLGCVIL